MFLTSNQARRLGALSETCGLVTTKPARPTRPLTIDELLTGFVSSLRNLSASCEHFGSEIEDPAMAGRPVSGGPPLAPRSYDLGPVSEIAARLRKLLAPSHGDDVFRRVCAATGTPSPTVRLSGDAMPPEKPPWDKVVVEYLSLGAIPVGDDSGEPVSIDQIGDRTCLVLMEPREALVEFTWCDLVKDVGDKDGVHLDDDRPLVWDFINSVHIGALPGIPLLLYRLAVAVIDAGNGVLSSVGRVPVPAPTFAAGHAVQAASAASYCLRERRLGPRPRRNDRCPCESGDKFKRCCGP